MFLQLKAKELRPLPKKKVFLSQEPSTKTNLHWCAWRARNFALVREQDPSRQLNGETARGNPEDKGAPGPRVLREIAVDSENRAATDNEQTPVRPMTKGQQ